MLTREVLRQVRRLQLRARRAVEEFNRLKAERPNPAEEDPQNEPISDPAPTPAPRTEEIENEPNFHPQPQQTKPTSELQNEPIFEPVPPLDRNPNPPAAALHPIPDRE